MRTPRWQPFTPVFNPLQQFQNEINRVFDHWGSDRLNGATAWPPVNVWEEGEELVVEAELPGLDLNALELFVSGGNQLTLKGERKPPAVEKGLWHRQERGFGTFNRTVILPFPVDPDKVDAHFETGLLTVRLAKHVSVRPRKISVTAE